MRILHVIDRFHLGGSEEHATNLAVGLTRRSHTCRVVAVQRSAVADRVGENQKRRLAEGGVPYAEIGGSNVRVNALVTPFRLLSHIREFKPELVHSNTDIPDLVVSLASRMGRFRVVRTIHNTSLWETRPRMGRVAESGFDDDLVIAVSQDALSAYRELRGRHALPVSSYQRLIAGSVVSVPPGSYQDKSHLVENYSADADKILLCFAGRLVEQKGFDILVDAVSGMEPGQLEKFELHAFTAGEGLSEYKARTLELGLPFVFHEPVADISHMFSAFDAILMPSRWEGYGRVSAEGFLAGTPVLACEAPGLRETFPPDWPLKVPVEDTGAFRDTLNDLLNGRYDLTALGASAQAWARFTFDLDREVEQYEAACREYLEQANGGGST